MEGRNIAQILSMTVEDAARLFQDQPAIARKLQTLLEVGLSYIRLGQSATTLGRRGPAREAGAGAEPARHRPHALHPGRAHHRPALADIDLLLRVLHQLRDAGNTIVVIEHNLDVIKTADWLIDMGPEGGAGGGTVVGMGTPGDAGGQPGQPHRRYLRRYLAPLLIAASALPGNRFRAFFALNRCQEALEAIESIASGRQPEPLRPAIRRQVEHRHALHQLLRLAVQAARGSRHLLDQAAFCCVVGPFA